MSATPTTNQQRIESLDVLRGFALLGILLLNIIAFALPSHLYFIAVDTFAAPMDFWTWVVIEIGAEGAMRCLFSILFGAGVAIFLDPVGGKTAKLHYRRTFWLMIFGLIDGFVLLWVGDILFVYALAGFILYWVRNVSPGRLLTAAGILIALMTLQYAAMNFGVSASKDVATELAGLPESAHTEERVALAAVWQTMHDANHPGEAEIAKELAARTDSPATAFADAAASFTEIILFVIPVILFWDALAMMLLGMALYKYGVLQGKRDASFYWKLCGGGFAVGLTVNSLEAYSAYTSGFELLASFPQLQWSYHLGRLGMAMGYLGLLLLLIQAGQVAGLRYRLAAVGRMALTNYLSHSVLCLFLFTGVGLGLAGEFSRHEIYLFVFAIWAFQLWFSPWWLERFRFGPIEWLWRGLTYGRFVDNTRSL